MGLVLFECSPMTVSHAMRHVDQVVADELFICRQLAGALSLEQAGREVVLEPGDMTLLDPRLTYTGRFHAGSRLFVAKIPRRPLEARVGRSGEMVARAMKWADGENGLVSAFLGLLPAHAERVGAAGAMVADQVLDLVSVALAGIRGTTPSSVSSARYVVRTRLRAVIEARLTDPALDVTTVAAAAGVSVRYANSVLAQEQTSVARLIQARRLERCRRALADRTHAYRSISEIAYSWGFSDMTHFGRRFKKAFDLTPGEYRRNQINSRGRGSD
jgi:AraC-like DNA-binding protein